MEITAIKQAVKNANRVNVFVDNKYEFSLDLTQLVDLKLTVGVKLTPEELEKYRHASAFGKVYQRTLEWVLARPRSAKETKNYLMRHNNSFCGRSREDTIPSLSIDDISRIISQLTNKGYLNDAKFASYYVENRFVKKGISKKRLQMELTKKGIDKSIIEAILTREIRDDETEIKKLIAKKRARYDDKKLMSYLARQGFSYDLIKKVLGKAMDEDTWD